MSHFSHDTVYLAGWILGMKTFKNDVNLFSISSLYHVCIHSYPCSAGTWVRKDQPHMIVPLSLNGSFCVLGGPWCFGCSWSYYCPPVGHIILSKNWLYIPSFVNNDNRRVSGTLLVTICPADCGWHWCLLHAECLLHLSAPAVILWSALWVCLLCICHFCFTLIWFWYLSFVASLQTCHVCDFHVLTHLFLFHMTFPENPGIIYKVDDLFFATVLYMFALSSK